jgi:hypothetical protein
VPSWMLPVAETRRAVFGTAPALVDIYRRLTAHGKDVTIPTKYPEEFKRDVVAVARTRGLSQDEIARDLGISTHSVSGGRTSSSPLRVGR